MKNHFQLFPANTRQQIDLTYIADENGFIYFHMILPMVAMDIDMNLVISSKTLWQAARRLTNNVIQFLSGSFVRKGKKMLIFLH